MSQRVKMKKQPNLLANFGTFTKDWLRATEDALGEDKESFAMLVLLFKKFEKQKLDYETLYLSVEEILPLDHVGRLLNDLDDLVNRDTEESICASPISTQDLEVEDSCSPKRSIEFEEKVSKRLKTELSLDTMRGMTPPVDMPEMEVNPLPTPVESEVDTQDYPDVDFTVAAFHTPLCTPDQSITGSPIPESNQLKASKNSVFVDVDTAETTVSRHIQYIVHSLERHTDSYLLRKNGSTLITPFKKIMQKAEKLEYVGLDDLGKDVDKMLNNLNKQGQSVDRVRKHYEYLVSYYFPSHVPNGRRRSAKTS